MDENHELRYLKMGYIDDDSMVRVDFFKPGGKWYCSEAVRWTGGYGDVEIHTAFKISLQDHFRADPNRLNGMVAVCLEPYHEHAHPLMLKDWSDTNEPK